MQEEIEHKTVNFAISTVKLSARTLLKGAQFFLRQYDKSASQGKQSMNRLIRQNRGVTNLEIEKTGIKDFDRCAKRYHIDYVPCYILKITIYRSDDTMVDKFSQVAGNVPVTNNDPNRRYTVINGYPVVLNFAKEPNPGVFERVRDILLATSYTKKTS